MKLKHLESALSTIPNHQFSSPKIKLEQYPTSSYLAASVILAAYQNGDLGEGVTVADLGCGTGILTIGASLIGCDHVIAVDCCKDALKLAKENVDSMEDDIDGSVDFVMAELKCFSPLDDTKATNRTAGDRGSKKKGSRHPKGNERVNMPSSGQEYTIHPKNEDDGIPLASKCVDTVLTNPPFGTKNNSGMDVAFLAAGVRLARKSVYSFHKTSTRAYLLKKAREEWNMNAEVVAEMKFDIPNMYKFHKKKSVDIHVDLLRVWYPDQIEEEESDADDTYSGLDAEEAFNN